MSFSDLLAVADGLTIGILGEPLTYTPATGPAVTAQGIFDAVYVRVDLGIPGMSSSGPAVTFNLTDLPETPSEATRVTRGSTTYRPHTFEPDGKGMILLFLHEIT